MRSRGQHDGAGDGVSYMPIGIGGAQLGFVERRRRPRRRRPWERFGGADGGGDGLCQRVIAAVSDARFIGPRAALLLGACACMAAFAVTLTAGIFYVQGLAPLRARLLGGGGGGDTVRSASLFASSSTALPPPAPPAPPASLHSPL